MPALRAALIRAALALAVLGPLALSLTSPLLAWRQPIYILAGAAGVAGLGLLLVQPLLADGRLPGLRGPPARRLHAGVGVALIAAVLVHVAGLWVTSPPDVVDALLFRSPTPFSAWGVAAMWAAFAAAALAALRRPLRWPPRLWRRGHLALTATVVAGTVVHALLIDGTMELLSKVALCALAVAATGWVALRRI
ncbi:MAG: ferric reductase [Pseudomonadota bacterium]